MLALGKYEAVIGLEVHTQLSTKTKIFCGCSNEFGSAPNSNICPVCLGMPGALPVLNRTVVDFAIRLGLATNCSITPTSIFARKNYFYPDLPKGYQISQYEEPICLRGSLDIFLKDGTKRTIGITRIHMEEDAGKSIHDAGPETLVDVNRCGTPLLEIVSEPELRTAEEASHYLQTIRQIVVFLGICDGNMEEGSLRCDANVSVRLQGAKELGTKTEVKNMNSFRNVERAIECEIQRQIEILDDGGTIIQQTLLYDADTNSVAPMRSKEEAHDYRYFPDPDLVPVVVSNEWIEQVKHAMPKLAGEYRKEFERFGISENNLAVLTSEPFISHSMEIGIEHLQNKSDENITSLSNWLVVDSLGAINNGSLEFSQLSEFSPLVSGLVNTIADGTISGKIAKEVFEEMVQTKEEPKIIIKRKGLVQISDSGAIEKEIDAILEKFPNEISRFRAGEQKLMGFFVGETMKVMKGKGNPKIINEILKKKLEG